MLLLPSILWFKTKSVSNKGRFGSIDSEGKYELISYKKEENFLIIMSLK